jgi:hypothetical protein
MILLERYFIPPHPPPHPHPPPPPSSIDANQIGTLFSVPSLVLLQIEEKYLMHLLNEDKFDMVIQRH